MGMEYILSVPADSVSFFFSYFAGAYGHSFQSFLDFFLDFLILTPGRVLHSLLCFSVPILST